MKTHAPSRSDDEHALSGADAGTSRTRLDHRSDGIGNEAGLLEGNRLGQREKISRRNGNELCVASISMRADDSAAMIVEAGTKGLAADAAIFANPATDIVANDDTQTGSDPFHSLAKLCHFTRRTVTHDSGKFNLEGPPTAKFHLKEVHAHRAYTKQHLTCPRLWRWYGLPPQVFGRPELPQDNCAHPDPP